MLRLAFPVVLAELGWMLMGIVDTIMVGPLGPEAIGAVGLGSALFMTVGLAGLGVMLGLDTLVSQAFGAGRLDECRRWLVQGVYLSVLLTVPLTLVSWVMVVSMSHWGLHPAVLAQAVPYLAAVTWSVLPLLLYATLRRYLQSMNLVVPVAVALFAANLVNVGVNWILIYGHLGAPALGSRGAALATVAARIVMAGILLSAIALRAREQPPRAAIDWRVDAGRIRRLLALGLPAAGQLLLEVGVFAGVTALAGQLDPASLASHQIALNLASLTFMVPLGVSAAGAVRVGQAVGRGDAAGASRSGWTALVIGTVFMSAAATAFVVVPRLLVGIFTSDAGVMTTGVALLFVAAIFQLFDGLQVVATGVLRGLGDTRTPMVSNLAGHWGLGLPIAYLLCFVAGWGVVGLWVGLSTGLIAVGVTLVLVWAHRVRTAERYDRVSGGSKDPPYV